MEWAAAFPCGSGAFELHILVDEFDDVRRLLHFAYAFFRDFPHGGLFPVEGSVQGFTVFGKLLSSPVAAGRIWPHVRRQPWHGHRPPLR